MYLVGDMNINLDKQLIDLCSEYPVSCAITSQFMTSLHFLSANSSFQEHYLIQIQQITFILVFIVPLKEIASNRIASSGHARSDIWLR